MHPYRQFIHNYTKITNQDWERITSCLTKRVLPSGHLLLEEGKICRHVYFLESGLLRYFVWKDGNDVTKFFTQPPYCFTSQRSFNNEIPAKESIEVLAESVVWEMSKADAYRLFELKNWSTFVRKLTQEVQFFTEEILEELQSETAENRYRKMLLTGDPLLQKVPLKHLASYLGIAPQSLSRIRKKLWAQKTMST